MQQGKVDEPRICRFQANGKCKFGEQCKFSHNIYKVFVMRHAQSEYNKAVEQVPDDFKSEEAKQIYQFNPKYVDVPLTDKQFSDQFFNLPSQFYAGAGSYKCDVIFVSPMFRALETVQRLVDLQNLKSEHLIVIPGLTEVFSKICDISGSVQQKIQKFPLFDFSYMKHKYPQLETWQDDLIDEQHKPKLNPQKLWYERYENILKSVFPEPMESYNNCLSRTLKCAKQIKQLSQQKKWEKVLIVSHNRILRYIVNIVGKQQNGQPMRLANCEIKTTYI